MNSLRKVGMLEKFRNYYLACRNEDGLLHGLGSSTRWRAFKFACRMTWFGITEDKRRD